MKKLVITLAAAMATFGAHAQTTGAVADAAQSPVRYFAGMGLTVGGDKLVTAKYTNGSSVDIKAGSGVVFTGGVDYLVSPEFALQGTVNFHVDDTNASNGSVKFQRFPIELIGLYQPAGQAWRFGGGLRYVVSPKLSSSGAAAGYDVSFKNTVSGVLETEYMFSPKASVKVRYVREKFKADNVQGDISGNHLGVSGNYYF